MRSLGHHLVDAPLASGGYHRDRINWQLLRSSDRPHPDVHQKQTCQECATMISALSDCSLSALTDIAVRIVSKNAPVAPLLVIRLPMAAAIKK